MLGTNSRPPERLKDHNFPTLIKAPDLQLGDFCNKIPQVQPDQYPRYFDISNAKQTAEYRLLSRGRKLGKIYQILKANKINKNILHTTRMNGDVYLVALDEDTSKKLQEIKEEEINIEENRYDNRSEGFLFNPFWMDKDPDWVKNQILDDHKELSKENIHVFSRPSGESTGTVKISFQEHVRPHRIQIGLQSLRVEAPKANIIICRKCFRIGHKEQ